MSVSSFEDLRWHIGHKIVCVCYGRGAENRGLDPANVSVECETCNEVLYSIDHPDRENPPVIWAGPGNYGVHCRCHALIHAVDITGEETFDKPGTYQATCDHGHLSTVHVADSGLDKGHGSVHPDNDDDGRWYYVQGYTYTPYQAREQTVELRKQGYEAHYRKIPRPEGDRRYIVYAMGNRRTT